MLCTRSLLLASMLTLMWLQAIAFLCEILLKFLIKRHLKIIAVKLLQQVKQSHPASPEMRLSSHERPCHLLSYSTILGFLDCILDFIALNLCFPNSNLCFPDSVLGFPDWILGFLGLIFLYSVARRYPKKEDRHQGIADETYKVVS